MVVIFRCVVMVCVRAMLVHAWAVTCGIDGDAACRAGMTSLSLTARAQRVWPCVAHGFFPPSLSRLLAAAVV